MEPIAGVACLLHTLVPLYLSSFASQTAGIAHVQYQRDSVLLFEGHNTFQTTTNSLLRHQGVLAAVATNELCLFVLALLLLHILLLC